MTTIQVAYAVTSVAFPTLQLKVAFPSTTLTNVYSWFNVRQSDFKINGRQVSKQIKDTQDSFSALQTLDLHKLPK